MWPAIASSGNTIHLIACTESDDGFYYNGINTCLVYYRGTYNEANGTISWSEPRVVGGVTPAEDSKFSGDSYAIAAKGNTVAIAAAPGLTKDAFIWKSTDNGENFTKTVFFETAGGGDTAYRCDGAMDVAIDDNGQVHVATGTYMCYIETDTSTSYTWWPSVGYLLYWNESMNPIAYNGSQDDANPDNPLVWGTGTYSCGYHGKAAGATETLSQVAQRIGWSSEVWDFSGDTPKLK